MQEPGAGIPFGWEQDLVMEIVVEDLMWRVFVEVEVKGAQMVEVMEDWKRQK